MLRTVLLLDGSEAMNSNSDYLPSYLLAMRPPLLRLVERYLDSTPLASLGVVVMRDGISHRLLSCTTNRNEIVDVLERDVFLHGGSGSMSIENGLRMAMSELVDMRKVAALAASSASSSGKPAVAGAAKDARATWKGSATQLNVLLISASVTLIDPTDVFTVVNTMAALGIRMNVLSLVGAVHVFDVCAVETGGMLYCPLNYDHLLHIVDELSTAHRSHAALTSVAKRRRRAGAKRDRGLDGVGDGGDDGTAGEDDSDAPSLLPIGCPVYLEAPSGDAAAADAASSPSNNTTAATKAAPSYYLACPQCHLIQLAVPTTCPMCRLLLCSAPMLYSTYVSHNSLVPSAKRLRVVRDTAGAAVAAVPDVKSASLTPAASADSGVVAATPAVPVRCALCMTCIEAESGRAHSHATAERARVWQCSSCESYRCDACEEFVQNTLGLCPHCVALR